MTAENRSTTDDTTRDDFELVCELAKYVDVAPRTLSDTYTASYVEALVRELAEDAQEGNPIGKKLRGNLLDELARINNTIAWFASAELVDAIPAGEPCTVEPVWVRMGAVTYNSATIASRLWRTKEDAIAELDRNLDPHNIKAYVSLPLTADDLANGIRIAQAHR